MIYCVSDIHGCFDEFMELLEKIEFKPEDTLYMLGDAIDRGKNTIKCLMYIMRAKNIHMLRGNHEDMMMKSVILRDEDEIDNWLYYNGGDVTLREFLNCQPEEMQEILAFLSSLPCYYQVKVNERSFILVHAGIKLNTRLRTSASVAEIMEKQSLDDMLWIREEFYRRKGVAGNTIIFGHTPIPMLDKKLWKEPAVWQDRRFKDKINIDGACVYGGVLHAIRLDDMQEFYVESKKEA